MRLMELGEAAGAKTKVEPVASLADIFYVGGLDLFLDQGVKLGGLQAVARPDAQPFHDTMIDAFDLLVILQAALEALAALHVRAGYADHVAGVDDLDLQVGMLLYKPLDLLEILYEVCRVPYALEAKQAEQMVCTERYAFELLIARHVFFNICL